MINLIVGKNALGKTVYLNKLKDEYDLDIIITNLITFRYIKNEDYNLERLEVLQDLLIADEIMQTKPKLTIVNPDFEFTQEFLDLMTLLCKNRKIVLLDEPDKGLTSHERYLLISFLAQTEHTYEDVYIVTHYEGMLAVPNKKIFTVDTFNKTLNLRQLSKGEAYEVID